MSSTTTKPTSTTSSLLAIPAPLKRLFDATPLSITKTPLILPVRARRLRESTANSHTLWIWQKDGEEMSFNPACLRWQAYLKFRGIAVRCVGANNHASPEGALPFLITKGKGGKGGEVLAKGRLRRWVEGQQGAGKEKEDEEKNDKGEKGNEGSEGKENERESARCEAYVSLLDLRIRRAWLYTLHLTPLSNLLTVPLYISTSSTSPFIQHSLRTSLYAAAISELLKTSPTIDEAALLADADDAFGALDTLLGKDEWFFGNETPGWLDAAIFAYTGLLLRGGDGEEGWRALGESRLAGLVRAREGLVRHQERIARAYFGKGEGWVDVEEEGEGKGLL